MTGNDKPTVAGVYGAASPVTPTPPGPPPYTSPVAVGLLAVVGVAGWWFALLVGAFIVGVLDFRLGRLTAVCAAGGGVLVALLNVPATKRLPKPAIAAAAIGGGLLFLALAVLAVPPGYFALRREIRSLDPPRWTLLEELRAGNSICFDVCTSVERKLEADTDEASAEAVLVRKLKAHGYRQTERLYEGGRVFRKGRFRVTTYYSAGQPAGSEYGEIPPGWFITIEAA